MDRVHPALPAYPARSLPEEAANYLTHGTALILSIWGLLRLLSTTDSRGTVGQVAGVAIYGGSMVALYFASTIYHAVQHGCLKSRLRLFDHATIYLLIAGTYTPFLLALPRPWPTWGLGAIWCLAALGIFLKVSFGLRYERLSMATYLAMGWLGILAIRPLLERISAAGVAWLVAGGLAYTVGTLFYVRRDVKYSHAVWHMFVVLGSALHYGAIVLYVVPLTFLASAGRPS
jgi:hemolysin III